AGFYAGGFANIPVGNNFSVEPGLYYSAKGYEIAGTYSVKGIGLLSARASSRLQSNYIDMPVLLKADFNGLQLFAGPQISYLTKASLLTRAGVLGFNLLNNKIDVTSQLNRWDAVVVAGAGYKFNNGIRLTATYERGLSKVNAGQSLQTYNQGIKIGAAMSF
ncbi:MAG: PorT family protein, partial [Ferruginibacter sp.]|nr:PorT family protein [Ferruginibacter sp.]